MAEMTAKFVKSPYDLPTYQRRLRHVKNITLRNLQCKSFKGKDITKLHVYFTIHRDEKLKEFYKSEEIHGSLNPSWQSIDMSQFQDKIDIQAKMFVLRVWVKNGGLKDPTPYLLVDWTIHLSALTFYSERLHHDKYKSTPNMVVIGMFDKYFIVPHPSAQVDGEVLYVPPGTVAKNSYTINSLSRIHTVLRAISQTQASVIRIHRCIEDKLLDTQDRTRKIARREELLVRIGQMKDELTFQMNKLQHQRDVSDNCRKAKEEKSQSLKERFHLLATDKSSLEEKSKVYYQTRENYIKENYQLLIRRKQLINELTTYIYPITETIERKFCICRVHLPNSEDFGHKDEIMCSVALGYTCHLVNMISQILNFPVRYPMDHFSSRSTITDHIHHKLTDTDRTFPLFQKGKDKFQFNYGVYLLNKNISQLRFYCGLPTADLRTTLPNIKTMLETKLGIRCDMERTHITLQETMSVRSGDIPDPSTSSVKSGGVSENKLPVVLDPVNPLHDKNGAMNDSTNTDANKTNADKHDHSDSDVTDLLRVKEKSTGNSDNVSELDNALVDRVDALGVQLGGFKRMGMVADSVETSSCGSLPENVNGIMFDRNYTLSPPPVKEGSVDSGQTGNIEFLNPNFPSSKTSDSPNSLTDESFTNSPSPDNKTNCAINDDVATVNKTCDTPTVMVSNIPSTENGDR